MLRSKSLFIVLLILSIFAISAYSKNSDSHIVPGVLQVKFEKAILKNKTHIQLNDFKDTGLKNILVKWNFTEGRKIFPDFMPKDTVAISLTGEPIKLKDLYNGP